MMKRRYWLNLFTGKTWEEFIRNGADVTGFKERRKKIAERIKLGDDFICYLTALSRFIGVLEVKSKCYIDKTPIWEDSDFPIRFDCELIYQLNPKTAVPIMKLKDKLPLFRDLKSKHAWTGLFRGSPAEFTTEDGELIVDAIRAAIQNPVEEEYDVKKYYRRPKTYETKSGIVTVPDEAEEEEEKVISQEDKQPEEKITHEEIQYLLLKVGSELGLDVWVAKNDRSKQFNGEAFNNIPNMKKTLPIQFDDATNRIIELIDVLWLQGDAIIAAFEVEHTTTIYSGLLRLSDLISMQPNIKIDLFIVGPDERYDKVFNEINRPTFAKLKTPLPKICKFIPYSDLTKKVEKLGHMIAYMKPEFIHDIAQNCEPDDL